MSVAGANPPGSIPGGREVTTADDDLDKHRAAAEAAAFSRLTKVFVRATILRLLDRMKVAEEHARVLDENNMMACETPASDCECCGCTLAREQDDD